MIVEHKALPSFHFINELELREKKKQNEKQLCRCSSILNLKRGNSLIKNAPSVCSFVRSFFTIRVFFSSSSHFALSSSLPSSFSLSPPVCLHQPWFPFVLLHFVFISFPLHDVIFFVFFLFSRFFFLLVWFLPSLLFSRFLCL